MRKYSLAKFLSLFTSLALVVSAFPVAAFSSALLETPDFVNAVTPPPHLGFVDSYFQGQTEHPVILIEDLHANYGVQQKIVGLLQMLQPQVAPAGRSMVIGMEGTWGVVDLSFIRKETLQVRQAVGDLLLKNAEITGLEQFAAMSEPHVRLVGIDNPKDYFL